MEENIKSAKDRADALVKTIEEFKVSSESIGQMKRDVIIKEFIEVGANLPMDQSEQVAEFLGICPLYMFNSDKPERQEGESQYQYKWRRKIMNDKTRHRGVYVFVSRHPKGMRKGKGRTFRKSDYTHDQLAGANISASLRLRGIDPNKLMEQANKEEVK